MPTADVNAVRVVVEFGCSRVTCVELSTGNLAHVAMHGIVVLTVLDLYTSLTVRTGLSFLSHVVKAWI